MLFGMLLNVYCMDADWSASFLYCLSFFIVWIFMLYSLFVYMGFAWAVYFVFIVLLLFGRYSFFIVWMLVLRLNCCIV